MAAFSDEIASSSRQNTVQIQFVDEEDLPLASFFERRESEDEVDTDFEESEEEEEENLSVSEPGDDADVVEISEWRREINLREELAFDQPTGPRIDVRGDMKSVDFFQLFFTDGVWNLIVEQTNLYAEQKREPGERTVWYPLTVSEFKAWIALTLDMGILKKPSLRLYWSTDSILKTSFFPSVMARDRYFQILRYLHFADNRDEVKDKDSPGYDKLFKIRKLLDVLLPRFTDVYSPERNLAVHETLIKFKGMVHFRQFIPIKPGRFGIKCFTLVESSSGYGLVSKVYTGKENGVVQTDLGRRAVMTLMESFLDKGYVLYMDNYYTSVPLFEDLERQLACGTVRSNRKGLPKDITDAKNAEVKALERGDSLYRQKGTVTCVGWKDSKMVYMLATTPVDPTVNSEVERSVKVDNKWQKKVVNQPSVIYSYNQNMGGVDLSDQRVTTYSRLMKGSVWYFKIFFYLLELSMSNAQIIMAKSFGNDAPAMLEFRRNVIKELVNGKTFRLTEGNPVPAAPIPQFRFNREYFHYPIANNSRLACKVHIQRVDTNYSCAVCGVSMCPHPCFYRYHTMVDYLFNDESRNGPRRLSEGRGNRSKNLPKPQN